MNRTTAAVFAAALALLVSLSPAVAGNQRRAEEAGYNWTTYGPPVQGQIRNFVTFDTRPGERYVTVSINDVTGMDVSGTVEQDRNGDGVKEVVATFCSKTPRPVRIEGGRDVTVGLEMGPCSDRGLLIGISGTVRVTFQR